MIKVNFFLRKREITGGSKRGKIAYPVYPILMRAAFNGRRIELTTHLHACEQQWCKESQRLTCDVEGMLPSTFVNKSLDKLHSQLTLLAARTFRKGNILTEQDVVQCVSSTIKQLAKTTALHEGNKSARVNRINNDAKIARREKFIEAYHKFVKSMADARGWSTHCHQKYAAMLSHLEALEAYKGNGFKLSFDFFDEKGLVEYFHFLGDTEGLLNKTVKKNLEFFHCFLQWSFDHKYHRLDDFARFNPVIRDTEPPVICLTEDELHQLQAFRVPATKPSYFRTKDLFLFSCYTGLRFSDIMNLRYGNVHETHLMLTTKKTDDNIRIPLNLAAKEILGKYIREGNRACDKVFPKISNQKINKNLKSLLRDTGITATEYRVQYRGEHRIERFQQKCDVIGFHGGRRTFISLALAAGVPPHVVMAITGKKTIASLRRYVHISEESKSCYINRL